jgi:protein-S-isoprenylcysteine O-methyltransferase Ste14
MKAFSKVTNSIGASLLVFLCTLRLIQMPSAGLISILLSMQSALAAILLVIHSSARKVSHPVLICTAWLDAFLPLGLHVDQASLPYSLPGLLLAIWSLIALGFSFSVAPEDRGVVMQGPYRFIRHPMYLGESLSLLGLCLASFSIWNWFVFACFVSLLGVRIISEERLLENYSQYKALVRWRLLPGVW